jgi:hypothetical protein
MKTKEEILRMNKKELFAYKWNDDFDEEDDCSDCYNCSNCAHCHNCNDCSDCFNCSNCDGCFDCDGCFYCFNCYCCRNLRRESYCICNIKLTREEYERKMEELKNDREDKELGLKIATSRAEQIWGNVLKEAEQLIMQSKDNIVIQEALEKLARDKLKELENENKRVD